MDISGIARPEPSRQGSHEHHQPAIIPTKSTSPEDVTSASNVNFFNGCFKWHQVYAALAANTSAAGLGSVLAYTATALPDLRKRKPFGEITPSEETWIGPLALLGAACACPVAGFLVDSFGRQRTIRWLMPPFVGGWILIALAQNMGMIYLGRFITGFCGGSISLAIPVFLAEVSDVNIRGALTSCLDMMVTVGILYIYLIGTFANWEIQAYACGLLPFLCYLLMLLVPESPRYLLQKGKDQEAKKAFSWFQNSTTMEAEEKLCENILTFQLKTSVEESIAKSSSWKDILETRSLKPIMMGVILMFMQQCSGILPITAYTVDIFHSAGTDINENLSTNIVGVIQVVATITSALVVDRCGRRLLLLLSESFMVISMIGMATYFYLKNHNDSKNSFPLNHLSWLPLTSLLIFVVSFSIGIGPICWVYMGEVLPSHIKGKGSGIVTMTSWILAFVITLGFGDLMALVGEEGAYGIFGGVSLFGFFYIYFCVPETKGKSLDEIQLYFTKTRLQRTQK